MYGEKGKATVIVGTPTTDVPTLAIIVSPNKITTFWFDAYIYCNDAFSLSALL
jgi:hypothetical protein